MSSCEWATTVTALAVAIAKNKTADEINFLAALLIQLGDTLTTLAITPPNGC